MYMLRILALGLGCALGANAWASNGLTSAGIDPVPTDPNNPATSAAAAAAQTASLAMPSSAEVTGNPATSTATATVTNPASQNSPTSNAETTTAQQLAIDAAKATSTPPPSPPPAPEPEHVSVMRVLPKANMPKPIAPVTAENQSSLPTQPIEKPIEEPNPTAATNVLANTAPTVPSSRNPAIAPDANLAPPQHANTRSQNAGSSDGVEPSTPKTKIASSSNRYFVLGSLGIAGLIVAFSFASFVRSGNNSSNKR